MNWRLDRRWQRLRKPLAVLIIATAIIVALSGRSATTQTIPVLVAAHDIAAGEVVSAEDTRREQWPKQIAAQLPPADDVLDRAAAGVLREGEPLLNHRVTGPGLLQQVAPDSSALIVSVPRVGDVALARPGDHVTLVEVGRQPRIVASSALILATDQVTDDRTWQLVVAVDPDIALDVATANALDSLRVILRAGPAVSKDPDSP